jgi:hypothetical protein
LVASKMLKSLSVSVERPIKEENHWHSISPPSREPNRAKLGDPATGPGRL